jgi:hypothetical protein
MAAVPTLEEKLMQSLKFQPLSSRARVACAAFALVFCMASLSFVVLSFGSASAGSEPPSARLRPEPAGAMAVEQRPPRPAPG